MRNEDMQAKLKTAFEHATPDVLGSVLSDIESGNTEKNQIIVMGGQKNMKNTIRNITAVAAAAVLLIGGAAGFAVYNNNYKVTSTISLDVNPSVEITANRREDVLAVTALNDDGRAIIGDMDFSGSSIDVTVNALIGSMLRNGYLTDLANSILISVDDDDAAHGAQLQKKIADEVNVLLQNNAFDGAVLSQTVAKNSGIQSLADEYGITAGKAQFVNEIVASNPIHTFEELAPLSINELNLLTTSSTVTTTVESVGQASDKAYIGGDRAKEIAFADVGIVETDVYGLEIEMDYERGVMVYEVDFAAGGYEYDYDVNATTGEIVRNDREYDDDYYRADNNTGSGTNINANTNTNTAASSGTAASGNTEYITPEKAQEIALAHAGLTANEIHQYRCGFDYDDGRAEYEVDFESGMYDYDYDIDAVTGEIVKQDKEYDDDNVFENALENVVDTITGGGKQNNTASSGTTGTATAAGEYITADEAKAIALSHAGVHENNVFDYDCEFDNEKGRAVYEIDFESMNYEHDYDIDAVTGEIIKSEKEFND